MPFFATSELKAFCGSSEDMEFPKSLDQGGYNGLMNIEHRTSNIECRMGKSELLNDISEETEELIRIFVTSIKTVDKKQK